MGPHKDHGHARQGYGVDCDEGRGCPPYLAWLHLHGARFGPWPYKASTSGLLRVSTPVALASPTWYPTLNHGHARERESWTCAMGGAP
eukprot:226940-Chlamydomonas_euryale.AAC.2